VLRPVVTMNSGDSSRSVHVSELAELENAHSCYELIVNQLVLVVCDGHRHGTVTVAAIKLCHAVVLSSCSSQLLLMLPANTY
jgi:hypothetical protein